MIFLFFRFLPQLKFSSPSRIPRRLTMIGLGIASLVSGVVTGCEQPALLCSVAVGNFAVRAFKQSGDDGCLPEAAIYGVEAFFGKGDGLPDFGNVTVAVQPLEIAQRQDSYPDSNDTDGRRFASGSFDTSAPTQQGICTVEKLDRVSPKYVALEIVDDPATAADETASFPAIDRDYEWSDLSVVYTPEISGNEFSAKLKYRDRVAQCEATYVMRGLWPAVACMDTSECEKTCETVEGVEGLKKTKLCTRTAISPEWLADDSITCVGAVKGEGDNPDVAGLCVFKSRQRD